MSIPTAPSHYFNGYVVYNLSHNYWHLGNIQDFLSVIIVHVSFLHIYQYRMYQSRISGLRLKHISCVDFLPSGPQNGWNNLLIPTAHENTVSPCIFQNWVLFIFFLIFSTNWAPWHLLVFLWSEKFSPFSSYEYELLVYLFPISIYLLHACSNDTF